MKKSMTYERLYRADDFRLSNEIWIANRAFGFTQSSGHYESIQPCSGSWYQSDRPHGVYSTHLSSNDHVPTIHYQVACLSARFFYAHEVLAAAYRRTLERFPHWLDHEWVSVEPGWRKIEFTSPLRKEAEGLCERLVREIAQSGEVTVTEQFKMETCDIWGNPVSDSDRRSVWIVTNVAEMDKSTETPLREMIERDESFVPSTAILRFTYEDIAPFLASVNPWQLSLINAEDGRPPTSVLDLDRFTAVGNLDIERALRLIDQGANINALGKDGETPLTKLAAASRFDHLPCDKALEARKTQADVSQDERIAMMRQLLGRGADVNLFGFEGVNALTEAVLNCEDEVVCFLLSEGADPNHNQYPDDDPDDDSTPLFYAANDFNLAERGSLKERKLERIYNALKDAIAAYNRSD